MKKFSIIALILFAFSGCGKLDVYISPETVNRVVAQSVTTNEVKDVKDAMSNLSKEEATILYKQYSGLAEFLENTNKLNNTLEVESVADGFQTTYKFQITDKKWLDFVEKWFDSRGWGTKVIVDKVEDETKEISRFQIIADFRILAEGAKSHLETKDGVSK